MALGGATDHIESLIDDGAGYAKPACEFCVEYDLDGVDFDVELTPGNSGPFQAGSMQKFIIDGSQECRKIIGRNRIISHAPQAPYMGTWAGSDLGYVDVFVRYPDLIDYISVQFYNQGTGYYDTYENLFIKAGGWTEESAVLEMANNGIPLNKIVVGKPVGPAGYANNGYVAPETLHEWGCRMKNEHEWDA